MDIRAQQAREAHQAASRAVAEAAQHRTRRDQLIRALRAEDPVRWTYRALAAAVGCSEELAGKIVTGGTRSAQRSEQ